MNFVFWQSILEKYWGISSKLSLLDGEFDLNILVRSTDDEQYVLKIMREDCLQDFVDMQIQAISHLKSIEPELPFPDIIETISKSVRKPFYLQKCWSRYSYTDFSLHKSL